jgi:hypothetical protein
MKHPWMTEPQYVAALESFLYDVGSELKCLPSFADPTLGSGNVHILRKLRKLAALESDLAEARKRSERLTTIADENFGPFPVQDAEANMTAIEQGVYELRLELAEARNEALSGEKEATKQGREA